MIESGYALHVGDNDGMERVVIKVRHNGPYKVTGPIRLIDADDNEYDLGDRGETIVLCRCGGSRTKPFCDSTHSQIGFEAAERAVTQAGERLGSAGRDPLRATREPADLLRTSSHNRTVEHSSTQQAHIRRPRRDVGARRRPQPSPDWWPEMLETDCADLEEGCRYRGVVKGTFGADEHELLIERLENCEEISISCEGTGVTTRFRLAEAQGGASSRATSRSSRTASAGG